LFTFSALFYFGFFGYPLGLERFGTDWMYLAGCLK